MGKDNDITIPLDLEIPPDHDENDGINPDYIQNKERYEAAKERKRQQIKKARSKPELVHERKYKDSAKAMQKIDEGKLSSAVYYETGTKRPTSKNHELINAEELLAEPEVQPVTPELLKEIYPKNITPQALQEATNIINDSVYTMSGGLQSYLRDNAIGLIETLVESKHHSFKDYMNAAKFITYKQAGKTNREAWCKTFPDRVMRLQRDGQTKQIINTYATNFSKSQLVTKMHALMIVPSHVAYQDIYHKAVTIQAELMQNPEVSPRVRSDAANSLMTHLKPPEVKQHELGIRVKDSNAISQLKEALAEASSQFKNRIDNGAMTVTDVSYTKLYDEDKDNLGDD